MVINPMCNKKVFLDPFQIERKIFHKADSSLNLLKMERSQKLRNMSAKITRINSHDAN